MLNNIMACRMVLASVIFVAGKLLVGGVLVFESVNFTAEQCFQKFVLGALVFKAILRKILHFRLGAMYLATDF